VRRGKGYRTDGEKRYLWKHWVLGIGMVPIPVRGFSLESTTMALSFLHGDHIHPLLFFSSLLISYVTEAVPSLVYRSTVSITFILLFCVGSYQLPSANEFICNIFCYIITFATLL